MVCYTFGMCVAWAIYSLLSLYLEQSLHIPTLIVSRKQEINAFNFLLDIQGIQLIKVFYELRFNFFTEYSVYNL
jgi:hypothetical protein